MPKITVIGGSGSGTYSSYSTCNIKADVGRTFKIWHVTGTVLDYPERANTSFLVLTSDVVCEAEFADVPPPTPTIQTAYLIADSTNYYTVENNALKIVPITLPLTLAQFTLYGMATVPSASLLLPLNNPRVLVYDSTVAKKIKLTATATLNPQTVITNVIEFPTNASSIKNVVCDISTNTTVFISFNGGTTWEYFNGTAWASDNVGMSGATFTAITQSQWATYLQGKGKQYKLKFVLTNPDFLKSVKVYYLG